MEKQKVGKAGLILDAERRQKGFHHVLRRVLMMALELDSNLETVWRDDFIARRFFLLGWEDWIDCGCRCILAGSLLLFSLSLVLISLFIDSFSDSDS